MVPELIFVVLENSRLHMHAGQIHTHSKRPLISVLAGRRLLDCYLSASLQQQHLPQIHQQQLSSSNGSGFGRSRSVN